MLSLQTFTSLVQSMAAGVQGACKTLLDLTVGSVLRAILEASASAALWLQWLLVILMNRQRLATCYGADVDTFVNDFGFTRLPGTAATGNVTFARFSSGSSATIAVGTIVMTGDGSIQFAVIEQTSNSFWNAPAGAYVIPANTASASIPVTCTQAGTVGNVQANTVSLLGVAISGVDTVNNPGAFTGGLDDESDEACKARFQLYILGGLSKGTPLAVESAIADTQQGLTENIAENVTNTGTYRPGNFVVTIDDGSGDPPVATLDAVYASIDAVRPICSTFSVQGPSELSVAVNVTPTLAANVTLANVQGTISAAITAYINALPVGATLGYLTLANVIFQSLPAGQITNLEGYTLNSTAADIVPTATQVVKAGVVTVG